MSKALFITGTGTDIGKTYVAGLIVKKLAECGKNPGYYKAAMSGNKRRPDGSLIPCDALACSVALKGIEIFEREDYMSKISRIEKISHREMDGFSDPRIREVRMLGGCTCVEVYDSKTLEGFQQFAYERGVFSRPFLKYMYSMVPYVIKEEELVKIFDTMKAWFK